MTELTYKEISKFIRPGVEFTINNLDREMLIGGVKTSESMTRNRVYTLALRKLLLKEAQGGKHFYYANQNRIDLIADFDEQLKRESKNPNGEKLMLASDKQFWSKKGIQARPGDTVKMSIR